MFGLYAEYFFVNFKHRRIWQNGGLKDSLPFCLIQTKKARWPFIIFQQVRLDEVPEAAQSPAQLIEQGKNSIVKGMMNTTTMYRHSRQAGGRPIDLTASVRSLLLVGRKKDDPNVRIMTHDKSSLAPPGPSLAFVTGDEDGFRWIGEIDISSDDLLSGTENRHENSKQQQALEMITALLAGGHSLICAELDRAAMEKGISSRTMRDARAELKARLKSTFVGHEKIYYME